MVKQLWEKISLRRVFWQNFVGGIGWSFGASLGFIVILTIFGWILSLLGGLPFVGSFFAGLISTTQEALELRRTR